MNYFLIIRTYKADNGYGIVENYVQENIMEFPSLIDAVKWCQRISKIDDHYSVYLK